MEETISLKELASIIKKRLGMIVVVSLLAALISGLFTFFYITEEYSVSTQFLVSQRDADPQQSSIQQSDIRANVEIINTYSEIISSSRILNEVIQTLDLPMSVSGLASRINVTNTNNSQVVTVSVTDTNPIRAEQIANTTVDVFQEEIMELMNVDNVNVLNRADIGPAPTPVSPNLTLNIAIAFVLGLMVAVGITFLLEFLDTTMKSEEDIDRLLELPVIGVVSHISDQELQTQIKENALRVKRERRA